VRRLRACSVGVVALYVDQPVRPSEAIPVLSVRVFSVDRYDVYSLKSCMVQVY